MLPILATFVILLIFGVGDMIATKTKAIVSMLFVASVVFMAGFWTGFHSAGRRHGACLHAACPHGHNHQAA